jgi:hypothetical protein
MQNVKKVSTHGASEMDRTVSTSREARTRFFPEGMSELLLFREAYFNYTGVPHWHYTVRKDAIQGLLLNATSWRDTKKRVDIRPPRV